MNPVLFIRGKMTTSNKSSFVPKYELPNQKSISTEHIVNLIEQLKTVKYYWDKNNQLLSGCLVTVSFRKLASKSNRLKTLMAENSSDNLNLHICGAKFDKTTPELKHIFTYYVSKNALEKSIRDLEKILQIICKYFEDSINNNDLAAIQTKDARISPFSKTTFKSYIIDCYYTESIYVDNNTNFNSDENLISIYDTGNDINSIFTKLGTPIPPNRILNQTTVQLFPDEIEKLVNQAPYLINMATHDLSALYKNREKDNKTIYNTDLHIPHPSAEPIIGVIDTVFNPDVYFSEWVDFDNSYMPNAIEIEKKASFHGTGITSIIVDGPSLNPNLEDHCGHFRVRHFGITDGTSLNLLTAIKCIEQIISSNREIKVWNLSLGTENEISENYISLVASKIDELSVKYDVIFVVAGTNDNSESGNTRMIGSPADSLNSIVVNSVTVEGNIPSYARKGPVLSYFRKPDVSYYGGDSSSQIIVCDDGSTKSFGIGTSYAAPWISRKIAYLIYYMGLTKEAAKALIIDSSCNWESTASLKNEIGFGIVPTSIESIIKTRNDEIKFIISGVAEDLQTFNYELPIPVVEGKFPYYAKATMVYTPECNRNQGVDYTETELDLHFGRMKDTGKSAKIQPINNNFQGESENIPTFEITARKVFRKWDNVKHIAEEIKTKKIPRDAYTMFWGVRINSHERIKNGHTPTPFSIVVTIKEMQNVNRFNEFITRLQVNNWFVHELEADNSIDLYEQAEEEVHLE